MVGADCWSGWSREIYSLGASVKFYLFCRSFAT